jgi:hypothetical protein
LWPGLLDKPGEYRPLLAAVVIAPGQLPHNNKRRESGQISGTPIKIMSINTCNVRDDNIISGKMFFIEFKKNLDSPMTQL